MNCPVVLTVLNGPKLGGGETVSKIERFHLVAAVVGFVADTIALASLFGGADSAQIAPSLSSLVRTMLAFVSIYGWFSICWFVVRMYYRRRSAYRFIYELKQLKEVVTSVVAGTAVLLSPLWLPLLLLLSPPEGSGGGPVIFVYVIVVAVVGFIIGISLCLLMPIFCPDIEGELI